MVHPLIRCFHFLQIRMKMIMEQLWHMKLLIVLAGWAMNMKGIRINQIPLLYLMQIVLNGINCWGFVGLV